MGIPLDTIQDFKQLAYQLAINPSYYSGKAFSVNKFGYNADIDATKADLWSAGGVKTYRASSDAGVVEVVSSSTNDTAGGTGARAVIILGYDSNGNFVSDWQELNGDTAVELDIPMMDVYRGFVTAAGSGLYNDGAITVRHKSGPVTLAQIPAGFNQTQMSHFIMPKGFTGFFIGGNANIGGLQGGGGARLGDLHLEVRNGDSGTWKMTETFGGTSNSGTINLSLDFPVKFPELTRIKASCTAETSNTRAYVEYDLVCINNNQIS